MCVHLFVCFVWIIFHAGNVCNMDLYIRCYMVNYFLLKLYFLQMVWIVIWTSMRHITLIMYLYELYFMQILFVTRIYKSDVTLWTSFCSNCISCRWFELWYGLVCAILLWYMYLCELYFMQVLFVTWICISDVTSWTIFCSNCISWRWFWL